MIDDIERALAALTQRVAALEQRLAQQVAHETGPRHNYTATSSPGADDDETRGYSTGSLWVNKAGGTAHICLDAAEGAANWKSV